MGSLIFVAHKTVIYIGLSWVFPSLRLNTAAVVSNNPCDHHQNDEAE